MRQNDLLLPADQLFSYLWRNTLGLIESKRLAAGNETESIEAAVIGIIDEYEVELERCHGHPDTEKIKYAKILEEWR